MLGAVSLATAQVVSAAEVKIDPNAAKIQGAATPSKQDELSQDEIKKVSEAFGHFIGRNLSAPGVKLDLDSIIKGLKDGSAGKPAPMSDTEYEGMMLKLQETAFKRASADNLKAANEFMDKNAKEKGIIVVEPGKLQYIIVQPGNGEAVKEHDSPSIQYTGKYIDGTTFGSSVEAGGPITIPLDQTVPGFSKGLVGMKEGEKRKLYVHPDLGYGTSGHLSPNALLIFDVEIIKANAPEDEDGKKTSYLDINGDEIDGPLSEEDADNILDSEDDLTN